ncbi:BrxE family protein [Desulfofundulus thermosubterraneus]|uniref:Uncharacterized protein n=1 Tax=Desulfofundulus thermosubterraneus DSM 16057 TaxID=1121432 RepID=A0A1M6AS38_9FIRM|nr:BrxE family protein [Desulfofundulus thermosubterraneus]SHI39282.1 hypothetical protein SAMN02745219_00254 [Desulfofundulus thermosubterraneus DSM 16057]
MTLSARLIGCRIMIARLGERDLLNWWDSEALTPAGRIVLGRLFPRTGLWAAAELAVETAGAMHRAMMPHPGAYNLFYLGETIEQQLTRILHRQKVPADHFNDQKINIQEILARLPVEGIEIQHQAGHSVSQGGDHLPDTLPAGMCPAEPRPGHGHIYDNHHPPDRQPAKDGPAGLETFLISQLAGGKPDSRTVASWQKKVVSGTVCISENTEAPVTVSQWNALLDRLLAGYTISDPGKLIMPYFTVKGNGALSLPAGELGAAG